MHALAASLARLPAIRTTRSSVPSGTMLSGARAPAGPSRASVNRPPGSGTISPLPASPSSAPLPPPSCPPAPLRLSRPPALLGSWGRRFCGAHERLAPSPTRFSSDWRRPCVSLLPYSPQLLCAGSTGRDLPAPSLLASPRASSPPAERPPNG